MPPGCGANHPARWTSFGDYVQKCVGRVGAWGEHAMCQPPTASVSSRGGKRHQTEAVIEPSPDRPLDRFRR